MQIGSMSRKAVLAVLDRCLDRADDAMLAKWFNAIYAVHGGSKPEVLQPKGDHWFEVHDSEPQEAKVT